MHSEPIIYLDYNATTPVDPLVMNEMLPHFLSNYGNPSSNDHVFGWQAKEAIEKARLSIAENLGAMAAEIIFTAGATESINMVLRGLVKVEEDFIPHIITVKTEHNAIIDTCKDLEHSGVTVTYLEVDSDGLIDLAALESAITANTVMVAAMWVNNETGVIQPMEDLIKICKNNGLLFMSDSTQAIGKIAIDAKVMGIDILVGSAHKIYGPKGVGFLYLDTKLHSKIEPIITGGGQEGRKRPGTLNVPSIIGMAKAIDLACNQISADRNLIRSLRDHFELTLSEKASIQINGKGAPRLYNTSNLSFSGYDSERIMQVIGSKVAASRGSACSTGMISPSHVLAAMGLNNADAHASIRFSFGRFTTMMEVEKAIDIIAAALEH